MNNGRTRAWIKDSKKISLSSIPYSAISPVDTSLNTKITNSPSVWEKEYCQSERSNDLDDIDARLEKIRQKFV